MVEEDAKGLGSAAYVLHPFLPGVRAGASRGIVHRRVVAAAYTTRLAAARRHLLVMTRRKTNHGF